MAHFRCPLCRQGWTFREYRTVVAGRACPRCGGDVGAHLAARSAARGGSEFAAGLAFFGAALVVALVLTSYVFGAEILEAAAVAGLGHRPIGREQLALIAAGFVAVVLAGSVLMLLSLVRMPRVPRLTTVVAAIACAWLPVLGLVLASRPWVAAALQHDDWPETLELVRFEVCGARFARSGDTVAAAGRVTLEVRNAGPRRVDEAVFTVTSGRSPGLWGPYGQHRLGVAALEPGASARVALDVELGLIEFPVYRPGELKAIARPDARLSWDRVVVGGRRERERGARPAATSVPVADCPGARRP